MERKDSEKKIERLMVYLKESKPMEPEKLYYKTAGAIQKGVGKEIKIRIACFVFAEKYQ